MHFSAKRGIEIASFACHCRPSVCNVGGSGPHRLEIVKLIARTISLTPSPSVAKRPSMHLLQHRGIWGETRGGVGKSDVLEHKSGNISQTGTDRRKVTMGGL